ncbi:DUF5683 domain-containing protein [Chitinophaga japonensis]|uniref:DUF5683 domain-containing protein n=1 Tax=Chitinophaga japonensis TaxID=104662 RepID=A0A562T4V6_CHIJA|nr:DUF5683 domain-containing protein [Chitinophaga japonensis]TWI88542.1 hypothetical protein LX66_2627 [Chitinophaga japonensis]
MANKAGHIFHHLLSRFLLILIIPACTCRPLYAQDTTRLTTDSARLVNDSLPSVTVEPAPATEPAFQAKPPHSPRKAAFYSAVLPGLGQAYNREYWKIPLVYAAMGISAGFFIGNFNYYKDYRDAYRIRMDGNANTVDKYAEIYPNANSLKILRDAYREYVDYSVLVFVLAYGLNIIDATVFAHLKDWNMSDDLSMRVVPKVLNNNAIGFSLQIKLGKGRRHGHNKGLAFGF